MGLDNLLGGQDQLAALIANLIRVGEVTNINPGAVTARVRFTDRENTESYDLHIVTKGSLKDKHYHVYDIGEDVLCLFLPSGVEAGFIIGAYYPAPVERPAASEDITVTKFGDGTIIQYDRGANNLLVDASASSGTVNVICSTATIEASDSVTIDTPETTCTGNLTVSKSLTMGGGGGTVEITGPVSINGPSLTHNGKNVGSTHTHDGVTPGGGNTGGPQ